MAAPPPPGCGGPSQLLVSGIIAMLLIGGIVALVLVLARRKRAEPLATSPFAPPQPRRASVEERLARVNEMHTKGLISEAELQAKRADILRDV